jgi:hypothetical protein
MIIPRTLIAALAVAAFATGAAAQRGDGSGPVAAACQDDIAKYCSDKSHGDRSVRTCLEANKDKVAQACRTALDTTGGGRGQGRKNQ